MQMHLLAILFSVIVTSQPAATRVEAPVNEYIKISVKADKDSLKAGSQGKLLFTVKPNPGFHVNVEPPISLELVDTKNFTLTNRKFVPDNTMKTSTTKDGYKIFNAESPVAFHFNVAKSLKPGKYTLQTKLTYYYCSDAEGWCSFTTEKFSVNLTIIAWR